MHTAWLKLNFHEFSEVAVYLSISLVQTDPCVLNQFKFMRNTGCEQ